MECTGSLVTSSASPATALIDNVRCHTTKDVLARVKISRTKFAQLRKDGRGPREIHIGGAVRFMERDLLAWLESFYESAEAEVSE